MNQLLKRRGEAEHAIKDLESLYTQTVVQSMGNTHFLIIYFIKYTPSCMYLNNVNHFFYFLEVCCRFQRENLRQVQQDPRCAGWR